MTDRLKSIKVSLQSWKLLWGQIKQDNPPSTWLIRDNLKSRLGFLPRNHTEPSIDYRSFVYLDFYDGAKKTMFLLKYGDQINGKQ